MECCDAITYNHSTGYIINSKTQLKFETNHLFKLKNFNKINQNNIFLATFRA